MRVAVVTIWAALAACGSHGNAGQLALVDVHVGTNVVRAEVVDDDVTRGQGLMFRRELDDDAGMLFVLDAHARSFSMKDTFIPLSIAYLDDARRIIAIDDLDPFDATPHRAPDAARYALEVNQGWFDRHEVGTDELVAFQLELRLR